MRWQSDNNTIHVCACQPDALDKVLFRADYQPQGVSGIAEPGSLDAWLVERYCLYASLPDGAIYRGEIHHAPWPIRRAEARVEAGPLGQPFGLDFARPPDRLHFSHGVRTVAWALERA
jgi:uncharacterized protein YqjF (DUF2071 family)